MRLAESATARARLVIYPGNLGLWVEPRTHIYLRLRPPTRGPSHGRLSQGHAASTVPCSVELPYESPFQKPQAGLRRRGGPWAVLTTVTLQHEPPAARVWHPSRRGLAIEESCAQAHLGPLSAPLRPEPGF
jgi:hypothetical protein